MDFDPDEISYRDLIGDVLNRHDPFHNVGHTQYRNGIWFHDSDQRDTIRSLLHSRHEATPDDGAIETVIEPLGTFHRAEDYHQKYYLRKHDDYMQLFESLTEKDFTDSTSAARLNGILAGKTPGGNVFESLSDLELPDTLRRDLTSRVS